MAAVPILAPLSRDEKLTLLDAFEEQIFPAGATVIRQVSNVLAVYNPFSSLHNMQQWSWARSPVVSELPFIWS